MKLRTRIPLLIGLTILLMTVVLFVVASKSSLEETASIERIGIERDAQRVLGAIKSQADVIQSNAGDYATWDETYKFMETKTQQYLTENYEGPSFVNLKLNVVAIFDTNKKMYYVHGYDWENDQPADPPADFEKAITADEMDLLTFKDVTDGHSDIVEFPEGLMLIASKPIITTNQEGPIRGALLMGRWIDDDYAKRLSDLTQLDIRLLPARDKQTLEALFAPEHYVLPDQKIPAEFVGDNEIIASVPLVKDESAIVGALQIHRDRPTYLLAIKGIFDLLFLSVLIGGITVLVTWALLDRMVLRRTDKLSRAVSSFDASAQALPYLNVGGHDELTTMANSIMKAFRALEGSRDKTRTQAHKIHQERDKLETILQSITDGVIVIDPHRNIVLVNHHASLLAGKSAKDLVGTNFLKAFPLAYDFEKSVGQQTIFLDDVFVKQKPVEVRHGLSLRKADNVRTPVAFSAAPFTQSRQIVGVVVILRDISLEYEVDRMKSEFVSIASHQLRTPLTGIKWMMSLLFKKETGQLNKTQKEYLTDIQDSNERMIRLVADLLDVSRIENNPTATLDRAPIDLHTLISQAVTEQDGLAKERHITVSLESPWPKNSVTELNKDKMYQVMMNLVSNAVKYSNDHGAVHIGCRVEKGNYIISFHDTGIGIPPDQQHRIFEKFFRADNAVKTTAVGTGLGLYYVKQVVEAHSGSVWFASKAKQGTTFFLSLPVKA